MPLYAYTTDTVHCRSHRLPSAATPAREISRTHLGSIGVAKWAEIPDWWSRPQPGTVGGVALDRRIVVWEDLLSDSSESNNR